MTVWKKVNNFACKNIALILILLAAIIGTVFILIVPPWEHYDEPGHFEYAWLLANRPGFPESGEFDQTMRREVGASLLEHGFHEYSAYHLLKIEEPISIIIPQTGDLPAYYLLVSLPLRLIKHSDITFQLYVSRFVSLSLFLTTLYLSHLTSSLLFGKDHPLAWMIPTFIIFLPSFVDIMTAVNNDVAAITSFSFFVWISIAIIKKGLSLKSLGILIIAVTLSVLSKSSAWLVAPLGLSVVVLGLLKGKSIKSLAAICLIGLIIGIALVFSFNTSAPAFFYATSDKYIPTRTVTNKSPVGQVSIVQERQAWLWQGFNYTIPPAEFLKINAQEATLGAYIWADQPTVIQFPKIGCSGETKMTSFTNTKIELSTHPQFFAFSSNIPEKDKSLCWVQFYPTQDENNRVYWDGIVLVPGRYEGKPLPDFNDADATGGVWDNVQFTNLLRNASGETAWPVFSTLAKRIIPGNLNFSSSRLLSFFDHKSHGWYFKAAAGNIFRSFWAMFGWGNVFVLGRRPYWVFVGFSLVLLFGFLISLIVKPHPYSSKIALFLLIAIAFQCALVLFRGVGSWYGNTFIPGARYFYPVILPVSILAVAGVDALFTQLQKRLKLPAWLLHLCFVCVLITMMGWSIVSLTVHF